MTTEHNLTTRTDFNPMALPDEAVFKQEIAAINRFQALVHATMIDGQDYGVIPGTDKPTLLKPGAEKISKLLGLADTYEIMSQQEDWQKPFFRYLIRCNLISVRNGVLISQGMGECNSMEAKYRWREGKRKCPKCGSEAIIKGKEQYGGGWLCWPKKGGCGAKWPDGAPEIETQKTDRVENDDIYSVVNTILKMSKKRALVDAALSAGRLSNVFTQDIEDSVNIPNIQDTPENKKAASKALQAEPASEAPKAEAKAKEKSQLQKDLETLGWTDVVKWLRAKFNVTGNKVSEIVPSLTPEQQKEFEAEVKDRLAMKEPQVGAK